MQEFVFTPELDGKAPLYEQIYRFVVEEIRAGRLAGGDALPSKRALSAHLGVSLSTVEGAYGLLTAEGYIQSRPRSGYRVCPVAPLEAPSVPVPVLPAEEGEPSALDDCFSTSGVDVSLFPYTAWARLLREAAREPELLRRGHPQGDYGLRSALCEFLRQYRGVVCSPAQVVVGAGMEYLLGVLFRLLPPAAAVALEDPGYRSAYRALEDLGRRAVPIPVDGAGLSAAALEASGAACAYVTPSHQFPLGVTMPAARRSALLRWAHGGEGRWLIEDDYDSEFRYASRPIPALQGLDGGQRVIYTGTFSRSLAPSIRAAYLILPPPLLEEYRRRFLPGASTVSRYEQRVLERFLTSGQYGRHLRRVAGLYRQRRAALTAALAAVFPAGEVSGSDGGLHLLFTLPGRDERELTAAAAAAGFRLHGLGEYCRGPSPKPGTLVLGFAGLEAGRAMDAVETLGRAFSK